MHEEYSIKGIYDFVILYTTCNLHYTMCNLYYTIWYIVYL